MTVQHGATKDALRNAEQIRWQRHTATLLGKILKLAAKEHLPAINWKVANAGATLHGECIVPHAVRREYFTAWLEAITSASGADPDIDRETTMPSGETRLAARWEWIGVGLTTGRLGAASAHVTLTANIWPDDL